MKPRMVWYAYSREFPHVAEDCYRWLTDYTEQDPSLTTEILRERRVLERSPTRVVMEVNNEIMGRAMRGTAEVRLFPDELRYEARPLTGDGGALHYTYRLTPLAQRRTRLDVRYGHRARSLKRLATLHLARPVAMRRIARMWDGFAESMARDLGALK